MVNATNKDSMQESRWNAFKRILQCNWGYWSLVTIMATLAVGTILQHTLLVTTIIVIKAAVVTVIAADTTLASCTFQEWYASNCCHDVAPFTCLFQNGGAHGGCSSTPWLEGTCTTQCDLTKCASLTDKSIYIFGYPMAGLSLLAFIVPFLLNLYVWPIRPNKVENALKNINNQPVEV